MLTLGSLFDGIGGFPLAGERHDIKALWASEIEAFPIAVTKYRFPDMLHVGDITKLDGATLPPVDVICGGSPCQDLSVAGKRKGLDGERSGLFMEQIRIIKEMRNAEQQRGRTGFSVRPRYAIWENVPGAFSSGTPKGEDFRIVLEEFCRIADGGLSVPRSEDGRWESAGCILGEEFSVAWRVYDTQYWPGTPQRRRRIYLVADFGGHTAHEILFKQHCLPWDSAQSGGEGKGTAAPAQNRIGASGEEPFAFHINQREETIDLEGVSGALLATQGFHKVKRLCGKRRSSVMSELTRLRESEGYEACDDVMQMQTFLLNKKPAKAAGVVSKGNGEVFLTDEVHTSLSGGGGQAGQGYPCVLCTPPACFNPFQSAKFDIAYSENLSPTLRSGSETAVLEARTLFDNHAQDCRYHGPLEVAPTIHAAYGTGGNNQPLVSEPPKVFCLVGNCIDRQPQNGGNGAGVQEDIAYTITATDRLT